MEFYRRLRGCSMGFQATSRDILEFQEVLIAFWSDSGVFMAFQEISTGFI